MPARSTASACSPAWFGPLLAFRFPLAFMPYAGSPGSVVTAVLGRDVSVSASSFCHETLSKSLSIGAWVPQARHECRFDFWRLGMTCWYFGFLQRPYTKQSNQSLVSTERSSADFYKYSSLVCLLASECTVTEVLSLASLELHEGPASLVGLAPAEGHLDPHSPAHYLNK